MELTQRLECTQELNPKCSEKEFPDQIGFLGICGNKYPLKKGPNKIGRDPDTCNIVLNLNSVSRQHAVINILNNHEFMLMDLDSANKTKLSDKTLQAYIPHPLKNGDMVQFGQVFGVFRLFEEDNDLPMTQAIDVPETPVHNRHVSKLNTIHVTTIPESPDVSDKDDSFIVPSQPKPKNVFKSPNNNFIKTSGKTISIKPVGTNKIDNVYWSSSKKSDSFSLQSNISNEDLSIQSDNDISNPPNIHELETQVTDNNNDPMDSIYNANTQVIENRMSPTIHDMETQVPTDLPEVCKIQDQHDVHINFTTDNKENDNNVFNAETQIESDVKHSTLNKNFNNDIISNPISTENAKGKDNVSDDIILFDEIDNQPLQDNFESQALLLPEFDNLNNDNQEVPIENAQESEEIKISKHCTKRVRRLISDSSTDCEDDDINNVMTQKIAIINDDDTTDCEDEPDVIAKSSEKKDVKAVMDDDITDCEDNFKDNDLIPPNKQININEMDTQIVEKDTEIERISTAKDHNKKPNKNSDIPTQIIDQEKKDSKEETCFEDLPTQIIEEEPQKDVCFEEALTQQLYSEEIITPFKVPKVSPRRGKKKDVSGLKVIKQIINDEVSKPIENNDIDEELYYAATQEIFHDLCSQRELSPDIVKVPSKSSTNGKNNEANNVSAPENLTSTPFGHDSDKKTGKDNGAKADNVRGRKEKSNKNKMKLDQPDGKNNTKERKTKKHEESKVEKKKSDSEARSVEKTKEKNESIKSKQAKPPISKSENEKVTKDMVYYLNNTGRRTRSRSNQKVDAKSDDKKELENDVKFRTQDKVPEKKNRSRNKVTEKRESTEKEVRRSRRQKASKTSEETSKNDTKSKAKVSKGSHEQSTVYNISSDSTTDSSNNKLKRSATENFELPSAKKSKTGTNSKNLSLRATPARKVKTHYVLFTAFPCEEVKVKLEKLGAVIVSDVMQCTVVLTMQVKRTFKLLCAVGLGKPIVGPTWVQTCADTNMIVDPWLHLIKDEATEKRFQFNLERSLATRRNFLKGYNVSSTPSVMPNAQEMKLIVECSGGMWKDEGPNWICVSAIADKGLWPALKKKGATIVSTEFILAGVLRQRVEIDKNKLD